MFSLFGRKDKSDARRSRDAAPERGGDTAIRAPTTIGSLSEQRELARRTAEKIDQIESEMIDSASRNQAMPVTRPMPQGRPLIPGLPLPAAPGPAPASAPLMARGSPVSAVPRPPVPLHASAMPQPQPQPRPSTAPQQARQPSLAPVVPLAAVRAPVSAAPGVAARGTPVAVPPDPAGAGKPVRAAAAPPSAAVRTDAPLAPDLESSTSMLLGDTRAALGGIQVNVSSLAPELEEAAILFANGQMAAGAATLKAAIARGQLEGSARLAWMMLFDVLQAMGAEADFESVALDYAARFERSPPTWQPCQAAQPVGVRKASTAVAIVFPARLDAAVSRQIDQARRACLARRPATLDFTAVSSLDPVGASMVIETVAAFERDAVELVVLGARTLFETARAAIEPGRRDEPDSAWHLALLGLRLLGEQQAFEDLSIDFCITYEVSPPSWEALPRTLRPAAAPVATPMPAPSVDAARVEGSVLVLQGELVGKIARELEVARGYASARADVVIDCRGLRRVDFAAAGELLNEVVSLVGSGRTVLFIEPSAVVEALFTVMGIDEVADVRRRRI